MYLPKRDELLLRTVVALPNASSTGFDWISRSFTECSWPRLKRSPDTAATYSMIFFAASVLPAPDSPDTRIAWERGVRPHRAVRVLGDGEDVRRVLVRVLALVRLRHRRRVQPVNLLERVDREQHRPMNV